MQKRYGDFENFSATLGNISYFMIFRSPVGDMEKISKYFTGFWGYNFFAAGIHVASESLLAMCRKRMRVHVRVCGPIYISRNTFPMMIEVAARSCGTKPTSTDPLFE